LLKNDTSAIKTKSVLEKRSNDQMSQKTIKKSTHYKLRRGDLFQKVLESASVGNETLDTISYFQKITVLDYQSRLAYNMEKQKQAKANAKSNQTTLLQYNQMLDKMLLDYDIEAKSIAKLQDKLTKKRKSVPDIPHFGATYVALLQKQWEYLESIKDFNLSNPYRCPEHIRKQIVKARKIAIKEEAHPSSCKEHTNMYKYVLSLLPNLDFEIYPNIDLEVLANRTRQSFDREKRKHKYNGTCLHEKRVWEDNMTKHLRSLPTDKSFMGFDGKGRLLYLVLRDVFDWNCVLGITSNLLDILIAFPQKANKKDPRHKGDTEKQAHVYHFIDWCPRGHNNKPCISKQALANGKSLSIDGIVELTDALHSTRMFISAAMEVIDSKQYVDYRRTVANATSGYKHILQTCHEDVFLGEIWNTGCVGLHRDFNDVKYGLSAMTCYGKFVGGEMCFPDLGIKIPYSPGTLIFAPTQALEHFIASYVGERSGMVHCSHESRHKYNEETNRSQSFE
jgi:hypothetical protein